MKFSLPYLVALEEAERQRRAKRRHGEGRRHRDAASSRSRSRARRLLASVNERQMIHPIWGAASSRVI